MNLRSWVTAGLLALGLAGAASAQDVRLPIKDRVVASVRTFSEAEILSQFGPMRPNRPSNGAISKLLPKAGNFIRWGGPFVIGGLLVSDALNWFYDQAQDSLDPALDSWWRGTGFPPAKVANAELTKHYCSGYYGDPPVPSTLGVFRSVSNPSAHFFYIIKNVNGTIYEGFLGNDFSGNPNVFDSSASQACSQMTQGPSLADIYNPSTGAAIRDIVARYIASRPALIPSITTPTPNVNQLEDNPYADPTLDTDGDDVFDSVEADKGSDPNDPNSKPAPDAPENPDEVTSTKTVTIRNPDGSTTRTTTTTYADGTKKVVEVTTKTVTTTNPDGSKTTKTTTTTTTTDRDGKQTTRTTTKEETTPAPEPEPEPPKDKGECEAKGGTWTDGEPGTCTLPPKSDKEKECEASGRVWDSVNETCGGKKEEEPTDECGNFAVSRLMKYPSGWLKDVVFPCDSLDWSQLSDIVTSKFPFSVVSSIKDSFQVDASGGGPNPLPTKLGPFEFDLSFADGFFSFVRLAFRAVIWWLFFVWLAGRLSGQVVLS